MRLIFACLLVLCASVSSGASLEWAGAVGNSGSTGEAWSVVRGTVGRCGGGVVVDRAGRIMAGGGDRILALSREGKLLWSTPLPRKDWELSGSTFAIAGKYLYFLAGRPLDRSGFMNMLWVPWTEVEPNLCRVEMYPGAAVQVLATVKQLGWTSPWYNGQLGMATDPTTGTLFLGAFDKDGYEIYLVDANGNLVKQFPAPGGTMFSIDETGRWYFGGASIIQTDKTGKTIPGTVPIALPSLGAVASTYRGNAMLTRGYIWDMGIYGFVGRFTRQYKAAPGAVSQWNHSLYFVGQIADAADGAYYIQSMCGLYLARVVDDQLVLLRRFGSTPRATALCLLPDGYIGVGNDETNFHWFDFANPDPASAPVRSQTLGPSAQGYAVGDTFVSYQIGDYSAPLDYAPGSTSLATVAYRPEPFRDGGNLSTRIDTGSYPVGQISAVSRTDKWVYALDTKLNIVLRGTVAKPSDVTPLATQPVKGSTVTSIATMGNDTLLVASDAGICICAIDAAGDLTVRATYQVPYSIGGFGKQLYLACDGNRVIAADSDRDRVVLLRADETQSTLTFVAQFGQTDMAGADDQHLDAPTLVSCSTGRIVVYDSANQRIVKLRLRE